VQLLTLLRARCQQHVGQRDTGPFGVAYGARCPRVAQYGAHLQHVTPAVARALHGCRDGPPREAFAQLRHRQIERCRHPPADAQPVLPLVELGNVTVTADVEVGLRRYERRA
jgi:hypothetical protein